MRAIVSANGVSNVSQPHAHADDPQRSEATTAAGRSALSDIQRLLSDAAPRTWLFAGDDLGFAPQMVRRSYIEYFGDVLRTKLSRSHDVVIDLTVADGTVGSLLEPLAQRVAQLAPDVVFFMPGLAEVAAGAAGREDFQASLRQLVSRLTETGTRVVLATPPLLLAADHEPYRDLPAYVSLIRQVAAEHDLLVIDHWKYWKLSRDKKPVDEWINVACTRLMHEGHRLAAQLLVRSMGIVIKPSATPRHAK